MKRFHVNISVRDLEASTRFYETLFGQSPTVVKPDYAKWMLDDPRINFSLSESARNAGISHIGIQADTVAELEEIQQRLESAGADTLDQPEAECCYARSSKTWVRDPDAVAWETFVTFGESTRYGDDRAPGFDSDAGGACCKGESAEGCCAL